MEDTFNKEDIQDKFISYMATTMAVLLKYSNEKNDNAQNYLNGYLNGVKGFATKILGLEYNDELETIVFARATEFYEKHIKEGEKN